MVDAAAITNVEFSVYLKAEVERLHHKIKKIKIKKSKWRKKKRIFSTNAKIPKSTDLELLLHSFFFFDGKSKK